MKTQSKNVPKRTRHVRAGRSIHRTESLHRRLAFHPITVLALLCVGILLVTFTINALADSFTVNGVVPAPPLTSPAVITDPAAGTQFSSQSITVSGTCPQNSYVNLEDNGVNAGTSLCNNGSFQVAVNLTVGSNVLLPQDYNITDMPGPASTPVTVSYVPPAPTPKPPLVVTPPPTAVPTDLAVLQVDVTIPYVSPGTLSVVSYQPTFSGIAPPFSYITVVVHSNTFTCTTYANAQGYWTCTIPETLPIDVHTVDVTARTPQGKILTLAPFKIRVVAAAPAAAPPKKSLSISSVYSYGVHKIGEPISYNVSMVGGNPPYAVTVNWGDGATSTYLRLSGATFTITHTYGWINASKGSKTIKLQAVDATGETTTLQLIAVLSNPAYSNVVAHVTWWSGLWGLFTHVRSWLWLLWPGYAIVLLLVFSFWLGERQELLLLIDRRHAKHHVGKK